ncbi:hypothetical protein EXIGLDRAFT_841131 [Exidia glandulosa HHB12029]|uniref:Uncharacterized protein n=1 Tax=Exidia glandulosa HHB12029 TaxID=1314781 RepID=A0A165E251_EXIGL|nr:hypothetical protein EXIGLDRAFT_841131 [Exidia glandulosa HHB12029]
MTGLEHSHGCESPPGPDALVLSADDFDATYSQITLTFNGTGVTLFGTELGAPASFDLDPSPTTVTSTSTRNSRTSLPTAGPSEPASPPTSSPAPTPTLAPVNCDFVLTTLGGLVNRNHTLRVSLQAQGLLYIYNATVAHGLDSPAISTTPIELPQTPSTTHTTLTSSTTTRMTTPPIIATGHRDHAIAPYVAAPLGGIALLAVGVLAVWAHWKRRRQRRTAAEIRAYGLFVPASEAATSHGRKMQFFADKALPRLPPEAAGISSVQDPAALSDLGRAVEQAGFSVTALVTSLRLVHGAAAEVGDADRLGLGDHPPEYDHYASR